MNIFHKIEKASNIKNININTDRSITNIPSCFISWYYDDNNNIYAMLKYYL